MQMGTCNKSTDFAIMITISQYYKFECIVNKIYIIIMNIFSYIIYII